MAMRRGQDARLTIDGVAFAFNRLRVSDRTTAQAVSNSEGRTGNPDFTDSPGFVSKVPDLIEGMIEVVAASFDEDANVFGPPPLISKGFYYVLAVYPNGLSSDPWSIGNALLVEVSHEFQIPGLQPLTLRFETDGIYLPPGVS